MSVEGAKNRWPEPPEVGAGRPLRVCLDLNVFVGSLIASRRGRQGTAAQLLVDTVRRGNSSLGPVQLVISWGMLNRLRKVLEVDLKVSPERAAAFVQSLVSYAELGAERLNPLLTLGGTGVLPMPDEEDAHVLETAIAGRAGFVVTSNLVDFTFAGSVVLVPGRIVEYNGPSGRILIPHPFEMAQWIRQGRITPPARPTPRQPPGAPPHGS